MHRLGIASVLPLLLLGACMHEGTAARPSVPEGAPPPSTPASSSPSTTPVTSSEQPAAADNARPTSTPPDNPPVPTPAAQTAAASAGIKAASQAASPRAGVSSPKASQSQMASASPVEGAMPMPSSSAAPAHPSTGAALSLTTLEQRLRDTHAIGVFTKLSLKNQVDDLLAQFKAFHTGTSKLTLTQLRQSFEVLLLKVVTLLQDDDPSLATAVSSSRDAIWSVLIDPKKFANI